MRNRPKLLQPVRIEQLVLANAICGRWNFDNAGFTVSAGFKFSPRHFFTLQININYEYSTLSGFSCQ
jgi:hypothetical protein